MSSYTRQPSNSLRTRAQWLAAAFAVAALPLASACSNDDSVPVGDAGDVGSDATDVDEDTNPPDPLAPQILFGDIHVHSTNSIDVYTLSVPLLGGRGPAGPAVQCDFARFCSQLDFWAITDHQEGAPTRAWTEARDAIQACNDFEGGYDAIPNMVSFLGFEWQQSAPDPETDFGHKNVIFLNDGEEETPARAISAESQVTSFERAQLDAVVSIATSLDPDNEALYLDLQQDVIDGIETPICEEGVDTRDLPSSCREFATDPAELYEKLDQWGFPAIVIPHGTTWGAHHPPLMSWGNQLNRVQHDPRYERLIEIYSAHGNQEPYREWLPAIDNGDGTLSCPEPTPEFLPCCYQAGEIIRARTEACQTEPDGQECVDAVAAASQTYLDAGRAGPQSLGDVDGEEWLDCDQCRDCFQPALGHRPLASTQVALASTNFDDPDDPLRYFWGFMGSTDTHAIGAGMGFRETRIMSDILGPGAPEYEAVVDFAAPQLFPEWERQNSYYYAGALVAVHSEGRSREAIFEALMSRNTYATSGERMMLWFDLMNAPDEPAHMGSQVTLGVNPEFEVRAVGSYRQNDGCPQEMIDRAPDGFVENICFGECYNPTDERHLITRIEVVRITPQINPDEPYGDLIEDPLMVYDCPEDPEGCVFTFTDETYADLDRPATYYVRAIQEPTLQLNAAGVRCTFDDEGNCLETDLCVGGYAGVDDDCLSLDEERAWASPIYLFP